MSEAGYPPLTQVPKVRLSSCKVVGRIGYVNSDPAMPFMLPIGAWKSNELAEHIVRACIDYGITTSWDSAKKLAISICRKIIEETLEGGFKSLD